MNEREEREGARDKDNPPVDEDAAEKGLGSESGAEGGPGEGDEDVTELAPDARGPVVYPDQEEFSDERPTTTPKEGHVDEDPDDTGKEASRGAED